MVCIPLGSLANTRNKRFSVLSQASRWLSDLAECHLAVSAPSLGDLPSPLTLYPHLFSSLSLSLSLFPVFFDCVHFPFNLVFSVQKWFPFHSTFLCAFQRHSTHSFKQLQHQVAMVQKSVESASPSQTKRPKTSFPIATS